MYFKRLWDVEKPREGEKEGEGSWVWRNGEKMGMSYARVETSDLYVTSGTSCSLKTAIKECVKTTEKTSISLECVCMSL